MAGDLGSSMEDLYNRILEDGTRLMGDNEQPDAEALGDFAAMADYVSTQRHIFPTD